MSEWQPIETAPKDGSSIIVCDSKIGFVCEACWWDSWYSNKNNTGWMIANCDEEYGHYIDATHWMPLPAPPKTEIEIPKKLSVPSNADLAPKTT